MFQQKFMKLAAFAIILLAVFNINNSLALAGVNIDLGKPFSGVICTLNPSCFSFQNNQQPSTIDSNPTINIQSTGYSPNSLTVKAGSFVTLHIQNTGGGGCIQAFTIPSLGLQKVVPVGSSDIVQFTAPQNPGQIPFMCSMGMYRGIINVI
jgi:plastocyanin domain-containing protein